MITLDKKPKICEKCGKKYIQKSLNQKLCGSRKDKFSCSFLEHKEYTKLYLRKNKDRLAILNKEWTIKNRDRINERRRKPKKEKVNRSVNELRKMGNLRNKKYYLLNKNRLNKEKNLKTQSRIKSDIGYKLMIRMRYRLWMALKGKQKKERTKNLIGCSIEDLKIYIEKQFKEGMTWNNYGSKGWTIDHIIPLSSVDLNNKEELKKVCHYSNLQPLWNYENSKKGAKIL